MQYPSCTSMIQAAIVKSISPARISRYYAASNKDEQDALRMYVWNAKICEAFYMPCHFVK